MSISSFPLSWVLSLAAWATGCLCESLISGPVPPQAETWAPSLVFKWWYYKWKWPCHLQATWQFPLQTPVFRSLSLSINLIHVYFRKMRMWWVHKSRPGFSHFRRTKLQIEQEQGRDSSGNRGSGLLVLWEKTEFILFSLAKKKSWQKLELLSANIPDKEKSFL